MAIRPRRGIPTPERARSPAAARPRRARPSRKRSPVATQAPPRAGSRAPVAPGEHPRLSPRRQAARSVSVGRPALPKPHHGAVRVRAAERALGSRQARLQVTASAALRPAVAGGGSAAATVGLPAQPVAAVSAAPVLSRRRAAVRPAWAAGSPGSTTGSRRSATREDRASTRTRPPPLPREPSAHGRDRRSQQASP